jgi:hypothetical protein
MINKNEIEIVRRGISNMGPAYTQIVKQSSDKKIIQIGKDVVDQLADQATYEPTKNAIGQEATNILISWYPEFFKEKREYYNNNKLSDISENKKTIKKFLRAFLLK